MFQLSIEATTANEMQSKLIDLARVFGYEPAQLELTPQVETTPAPAKKSKKQQPPPLTQEEKLVAEASIAAPTEKEITEADILAAVESITKIQGKGIPAARKLLQSFGANKVPELKKEDYAAFLEKAKKEAAA